MTTINIDDKKIIKAVKFKFPQLMGEQAEHKVMLLYQDIIATDELLAKAREEVRSLEKELQDKKDEFNSLSSILEIEYGTKTVNLIEPSEMASFAVNNPTDGSRRSYNG